MIQMIQSRYLGVKIPKMTKLQMMTVLQGLRYSPKIKKMARHTFKKLQMTILSIFTNIVGMQRIELTCRQPS